MTSSYKRNSSNLNFFLQVTNLHPPPHSSRDRRPAVLHPPPSCLSVSRGATSSSQAPDGPRTATSSQAPDNLCAAASTVTPVGWCAAASSSLVVNVILRAVGSSRPLLWRRSALLRRQSAARGPSDQGAPHLRRAGRLPPFFIFFFSL